MYATRMPGTSSGEKTCRSCVAPVRMTWAGSTPGAVVGSLSTRTLTKAVWAAATKKEPPTVRKTKKQLC